MTFPRWFPLVALIGALLVPGCKTPPVPPDPSVAVDSLAQPADTVGDFTAADTLILAGQPPRRGLGPSHLAFGLFTPMPQTMWGKYGITGVVGGVQPKILGGLLRAADRVGLSLVPTFPRKRLQTSSGRFSLSLGKALVDEYARYFPPDSLQKYLARGVLVGFLTGDDFGCAACYGGQAITQAMQAPLTIYAKQKLGNVPLGVRVAAEWVRDYNGWQHSVDFAWAQYLTRRGPATTWIAKQASIARSIGIKMGGGLNIHSCHLSGTDDPCSGSEIRQWLPLFFNDSTYCVVVSWRYDEQDWANSSYRSAFIDMGAQAATKSRRSCAT